MAASSTTLTRSATTNETRNHYHHVTQVHHKGQPTSRLRLPALLRLVRCRLPDQATHSPQPSAPWLVLQGFQQHLGSGDTIQMILLIACTIVGLALILKNK